jgi:drug/metabolite transporter (DMT)-like permease
MFLTYFSGIIAVFLWALLPVFVKESFAEIPVTYFLVLRFFATTLLFVGFLPNLLRKISSIPKKLLAQIFVILGMTYLMQSLAIKELPVSWYLLIFSLNPLIASILLGFALNSRIILGFVFAAVGVLSFLAQESGLLHTISIKSFLFLGGGMLMWVLYTVVAQKIQKNLSDFESMLMTNVLSLGSSLLIWILNSRPTVSLLQISSTSWGALILSSLGLPLAYYFYLYCLRRAPLFSQMSQYLELIFGLFFSAFFYKEHVDFFKVTGALFIVAALVTTVKKTHAAE